MRGQEGCAPSHPRAPALPARGSAPGPRRRLTRRIHSASLRSVRLNAARFFVLPEAARSPILPSAGSALFVHPCTDAAFEHRVQHMQTSCLHQADILSARGHLSALLHKLYLSITQSDAEQDVRCGVIPAGTADICKALDTPG